MRKSRVTAAFLAFVLGTFGVHKFYLKKPGEGILFIFLFSFISLGMKLPLTTLLGFFDAVRLLLMNDEDFDQKYNKGVQEWQSSRRRGTRNKQTNSRRAVRDRHQSRSRPSTRTRASTNKKARFQREHRPSPSTRRRKNYPKNNPFKQSGIRKFKEYDIKGAIEDFTKAVKMSPNDPALHFNLACSYSLNENTDKSFYHLQKAIENGFNDIEKIATHEALAHLRVQDDYEKFKENGYKLAGSMQTQIESSQAGENLLDEDVLLKQLNKLDELRGKGLLTEAEFVEQKRRLMG